MALDIGIFKIRINGQWTTWHWWEVLPW
jgi:hypothetical protein